DDERARTSLRRRSWSIVSKSFEGWGHATETPGMKEPRKSPPSKPQSTPEDKLDEELEESFPASDPPSNTPTSAGGPERWQTKHPKADKPPRRG
ncbi:MAG TPA: hypothetical protein VIJ63_12135, partial [Roseiarcus sp.]